MQIEHPQREIIALKEKDTAVISQYSAYTYTHELHYHAEFELILIEKGFGMQRTIGNSSEPTDDTELILLGPNLHHKWKTISNTNISKQITSIHFKEKFLLPLNKREPEKLQALIDNAAKGIIFSNETAIMVRDRLTNIISLKKKDIKAETTSLLTTLASAKGLRYLNNSPAIHTGDKVMKKLDRYLNKNLSDKTTLQEASNYTGKSVTSFNRFIKKHTGTSFVNYLNRIKAGAAGRKLSETSQNVADIAKNSGFNNLANFNRVFKNIYDATPLQYRKTFYGRKKYI